MKHKTTNEYLIQVCKRYLRYAYFKQKRQKYTLRTRFEECLVSPYEGTDYTYCPIAGTIFTRKLEINAILNVLEDLRGKPCTHFLKKQRTLNWDIQIRMGLFYKKYLPHLFTSPPRNFKDSIYYKGFFYQKITNSVTPLITTTYLPYTINQAVFRSTSETFAEAQIKSYIDDLTS